MACQHSKGIWPTCYGYVRGNNPTEERKLWMRANMVQFCEENKLHLERIFHDWQVAPNRVGYPGLLHTIEHAAEAGTHTLLLGDLDLIDNPSQVLAVLAETLMQNVPGLNVVCLVDERAFEGLDGP